MPRSPSLPLYWGPGRFTIIAVSRICYVHVSTILQVLLGVRSVYHHGDVCVMSTFRSTLLGVRSLHHYSCVTNFLSPPLVPFCSGQVNIAMVAVPCPPFGAILHGAGSVSPSLLISPHLVSFCRGQFNITVIGVSLSICLPFVPSWVSITIIAVSFITSTFSSTTSLGQCCCITYGGPLLCLLPWSYSSLVTKTRAETLRVNKSHCQFSPRIIM